MVTAGTHFFGYGSLVNLATHDYQSPRKAQTKGWRRQWVYSASRDQSFLSVVQDPHSTIQGLIADVSHIGWDALDIRETEYERVAVSQGGSNGDDLNGVQIYRAAPHHVAPKGPNKPILLSYIDCVVQGFLGQFGESGVAGFFDTTSGWNRPVKNDRTAPIYPRAQRLSVHETSLVDDHLAKLSAVIEY